MTLAIYGSGDFGTTTQILALQIMEAGKAFWNEMIFIDDSKENVNKIDRKVLDFEEFKQQYKKDDARLIIAVGEPKTRKILADKIKEEDYEFGTLIHPSVYVHEKSLINKGCIIAQGSYIGMYTSIGENTIVMPANTSIGHGVSIGCNTVIGCQCAIAGNTTIGDQCFIGSGTSIRDKITIGEKTIIGMGSHVGRSIESGVIAFGNPAKIMMKNVRERVFK